MQHSIVSLASCHSEVLLDQNNSNVNFDADWSISRTLLYQGVSQGVEVIELSNGPLKVWVLPTRGMGIWKAEYQGLPLGWDSPVKQPVNPLFVNAQSRNGLGWLDGFNELVCRCGLSFNGPPGHDAGAASPIESDLTLHGKIANIPAHSVEVFVDAENGGTIGVTGIVEESTLFGPQLVMKSTISISPYGNIIYVQDEITNRGSASTELQLLYHANFGQPFLQEGSEVSCPAKLIVPRDMRAAEGIRDYSTYLGPTDGYAEQVYFFELLADAEDQTLALLSNQAGDKGVSVHFNQQQLPCFAVWKCTQSEASGYVTGLEPATNYPNFKAFERHHQRVVNLPAGETFHTGLQIQVHTTFADVQTVRNEIKAILSNVNTQVFTHPTEPFCSVDK